MHWAIQLVSILTSGAANDLVGADEPLPDMVTDTLIADTAFDDDDRVIKPLTAAGETARNFSMRSLLLAASVVWLN
jgi:hypothetical protein